jgi:uncharacterized membrane protein YozB (DUF420 family)
MRLMKRRRSSNHLVWKVLGGSAVTAVVIAVVASIPDIKRYIKISTM